MKNRNKAFRIEIFVVILIMFLSVFSAFCMESVDRSRPREGGKQPCPEYSLIKKENKQKFEWTLKYQNATASIEYPKNETDQSVVPTLAIYACDDIDHDGSLEALVEFYSGEGAHCCFEYSIYKKKGNKLIQHPIEGCCSFKFQDINGDGVKEIITHDFRLQYFGGLCSACSPVLPKVLCFRHEKFENCTKDFPKLIETEIRKTLNEKSPLGEESDVALKYLALHILLEKEDEGWQGIKKYYPDNYKWLKKNEADLKQRLSRESQGRF